MVRKLIESRIGPADRGTVCRVRARGDGLGFDRASPSGPAPFGRGGGGEGAPCRHREEGGGRHGHPRRPGRAGGDGARVPQLSALRDRGRVSAGDAARTRFRPRGAQHPTVRPRFPRRPDRPYSGTYPSLSTPPGADDGAAHGHQTVGAGTAGGLGHRHRRSRPPRRGDLPEDDLRPRFLPCRSAPRQPDGDGGLHGSGCWISAWSAGSTSGCTKTSAKCWSP